MDTALFDKALRERGLSQTKLAQRLDINPATIGRAYRGDFEPRLDIARRIARELGVTVDALFPGEAGATPADPPKARRLRAIKGGAPARPPKREAPTSAADAGRAGGLARAKALTPEQLSEQAKHANRVRWSRAAKANAMCGRHHPHLRLIRSEIPAATHEALAA